MKKIITFFALALTLASCKKSDLQLLDPNSPTPAGALATQVGIEEFALGIWNKTYVGVNLLSHSLVMHSIMGDEQWSSVGNWGWRYVNQVDKITLPAPYNTVVPNVFNTPQLGQLKSLNTLVSANGNATDALIYEWNLGYYTNAQANLLLSAVAANSTISATEKAVLQAWAYWWKGYGYARVGSMYLAGVINNSAEGTTNPTYVSHDAIIAESNANFEKAIALLTPIAAGDATYTSTMKAIMPSYNVTAITITPAMWIRECYTMEARNFLVNHKVATMTATDWNTVKTLAAKGLVQGDQAFVFGMSADGLNDLSPGTQQHPYQWDSNNISPGWTFASERWVQDFKTGDVRFTKGVTTLSAPEVNRSSRGIQFGTRYKFVPIESGGYWSSDKRQGQLQYAGSWEENQLMLAEANINTGTIDAGLAIIDQVRTANGAGLAAVASTGLNLVQAKEELRKERRIALFLRGLAFYDARRWGITAPASAGGGRANANVMVPNSLIGTTPASSGTILPCFIDYNYADYWDVPVTEFSYNPPASGSPAIAN